MFWNLRVVKMRELQHMAEYGKKMPDPAINFAPGISVCKPASQRRAARARKETNGRSFS